MSAENVEKVRQFYPEGGLDMVEVMGRDGLTERLESRFGEIFQPDFETRSPESDVTPSGRGMTGYVEGWRDWLAPWETWSVSFDQVLDAGDQVVVVFDIKARPKGAEAEVERRGANVLTFVEGRIASVDLYMDHNNALRSAGLDPQEGEAPRR